MRLSITALLFAVGISACAHIQRPSRKPPETPQVVLPNTDNVDSRQPEGAIEIRARVKDAVRYEGFAYGGRHWLTGTAVGTSDSTLTLRMRSGGGTVVLSLRNIVQLETRGSPTSPWRSVTWWEDKQTLFATLQVLPVKEDTTVTTSKVADAEVPARVRRTTVAYGFGVPYGDPGVSAEMCLGQCRFSVLAGTGLEGLSTEGDLFSPNPDEFRVYSGGFRLNSRNERHRTFIQLHYCIVAWEWRRLETDILDFRKHYGVASGGGYKFIAHGGFTFIANLDLAWAPGVGIEGPLLGLGFGYSW